MGFNTLSDMLDTKRFRIIDSHAHVGFYNQFSIKNANEDDLVKQMDEVGIEKMAFSPMQALNIDCVGGNDYTANIIKKYPGRFIGMATVNPHRREEILPELGRCFDRLGMSMIKLHPEEANCPMDNPVYDLVLGFAAERKLAILNHDWQSPKRMEKLAVKYPGITFIQAHSGGNWDGSRIDDYFRVAREYPNAYIDICASPVFYNALERLTELVGSDKILFGSDAPFLNLGYAVGKVMMANISTEDKQKIFADNFLQIIKE